MKITNVKIKWLVLLLVAVCSVGLSSCEEISDEPLVGTWKRMWAENDYLQLEAYTFKANGQGTYGTEIRGKKQSESFSYSYLENKKNAGIVRIVWNSRGYSSDYRFSVVINKTLVMNGNVYESTKKSSSDFWDGINER